MTPSTTDPDAGRVEELPSVDDLVRLVLAEGAEVEGGHDFAGLCPDPSQPDSRDPECPACQRIIAAADTLAALRERAEHWERAWMQASEAETDAVRRAESAEERAERAQEQYERAMSIIREDELEDLTEQRDRLRAALDEARALVKSAWCEGHNIGLGDGHPLAGPPHRWEDSDACADLAALSDSPAPEVRDG